LQPYFTLITINKMAIITFIFLLLFALGLVIFFKFFAVPYIVRQYKGWLCVRKLKKMAKNKPPELQEQLKELAEGFAELMRQDKM